MHDQTVRCRRNTFVSSIRPLILAGLLALTAGLTWNDDRNLLEAAPNKDKEIAMPLVGKIDGDRDISGAALVGDHLVVVSDNSSKIAVFRRKPDRFVLVREITLDPTGAG